MDLEAALREQMCLNSFISGYRLAQGIQQELLADQPPYNFEDEDERRACEITRGDIRLEKLTTIQIQKYYNDLQKNGRIQRYKHIELKEKGLSVRVVHGIHTLLNNCLEQAVKERLLLVNPAQGL